MNDDLKSYQDMLIEDLMKTNNNYFYLIKMTIGIDILVIMLIGLFITWRSYL
jgi:hypothetical protein